MRNLIAILAVLAMGVNAMAAVDFVATDNMDGTAELAWAVTEGEAIAGMALEMSVVSGGADLSVAFAPATEGGESFNVFIDEAYDIVVVQELELEALPASNPIANADTPGVASVSTDMPFVICGGYLAENNPGLAAGKVAFAATETTEVAVDVDATRGGIVALGGTAVMSNLPMNVMITADIPVCKGDANNDGKISPADMAAIVAFVSPAYAGTNYTVDPVPAGYEAYDANADGKISPADMAAIVSFLSPAYAGSNYTYEGCMP